MKTIYDQDSWEEKDDAPKPALFAWIFGALIVTIGLVVYKILGG